MLLSTFIPLPLTLFRTLFEGGDVYLNNLKKNIMILSYLI